MASEVTFDLVLDGYSWMDYIASRGWDVWLVDIRGFGRSTKPPEFDLPQMDAPPLARTEEARRDLDRAISHVLEHRGITQLNLLAWSWGTIVSGGWVGMNPGVVRRIAMFGPAWSVGSPAGKLPGYSLWSVEEAFYNLQAGAPAEWRTHLTPKAWYLALEAAALATDDGAHMHSPPRVRSPAGMMTDVIEAAATGRPFYNPAAIKADILLVVGEWDGVTPPSKARSLFSDLTHAASKRFVEIGGATHLAHLENRRTELFEVVQTFLESN